MMKLIVLALAAAAAAAAIQAPEIRRYMKMRAM